MKKFKKFNVGEKVCWYTSKRNVGEITEISEDGIATLISTDEGYGDEDGRRISYMHVYALKRLVKKKSPKQTLWIVYDKGTNFHNAAVYTRETDTFLPAFREQIEVVVK